jgi:hypothetical protein
MSLIQVRRGGRRGGLIFRQYRLLGRMLLLKRRSWFIAKPVQSDTIKSAHFSATLGPEYGAGQFNTPLGDRN